RPERQTVVDGKGAVEKNAAEGRRPVLVDLDERGIHRLDRNEAQAVVDEVRRHVRQHDEPRGQPKPPDHAVHLRSCFKPRPRALLLPNEALVAEGVSRDTCLPMSTLVQRLLMSKTFFRPRVFTRPRLSTTIHVSNMGMEGRKSAADTL